MRAMASVSLALAGSSLFLAGCGASNPFRAHGKSFQGPDEVAVPYGTQDTEDVTGSVTPVNTAETENLQSVLDMLRGHVPGLYVRELPSGDILLGLRGGADSVASGTAPLLVVDDMPVSPNGTRLALKGINPRDVASIQVLKDVSTTAMYGTRGSSGVILIYLKR